MAPPAWLHNKISREDTEELVKAAGVDNGRFLVRTREGKPGEYVLCVVFKGKPTHHLISKNPDGNLTVNKKTFGGHKKIADLVSELSTKTAGWPVPLDKPVAREGAGAAAAAPKAKAAPAKKAPVKTAAAGKGVYVHKGISREKAEELVTNAGLQDGRFLLRTREGKPGEYVLCVCFKGKPTHHLMGKNADGVYIINKKSYGDFKKPAQLIAHLGKKGPGWPVPLDKPVYVEAKGGDDGAAKAAAKEAKAAAMAKAKADKEEADKAAAAAAAEAAPASAADPEPEPEPEPEPAAEEAAAPPPAAAAAPAPAAAAAPEDGATDLGAAARAAADAAAQNVAAKKAELEDLRAQALLSGPNLSAADMPKKVTPGLARAVIQMGKRLHELEMKMGQLNQLMESLMGHAQRLDAAASGN